MSGICLSNKKLLLLAISAVLLASCAPYHAQKGAIGFRQQGEASWYGPGFHGRKTASGERFNTGAMTAAHRTLPFGTTVRVTNLENGKSTLVRINDRGPFAHGRIIDLSKAAAREVGLLGTGTAAVEIRAVGPGKEDEELMATAAGAGKEDDKILLASRGPVTRNGVEHLISVETGANPEEKTIEDEEGGEDSIGVEEDGAGFDGPDPKEISYNTNDSEEPYSVDDEPF